MIPADVIALREKVEAALDPSNITGWPVRLNATDLQMVRDLCEAWESEWGDA